MTYYLKPESNVVAWSGRKVTARMVARGWVPIGELQALCRVPWKDGRKVCHHVDTGGDYVMATAASAPDTLTPHELELLRYACKTITTGVESRTATAYKLLEEKLCRMQKE